MKSLEHAGLLTCLPEFGNPNFKESDNMSDRDTGLDWVFSGIIVVHKKNTQSQVAATTDPEHCRGASLNLNSQL